MQKILRNRSLRFWITLSMAIALVPLALSAAAGYVLLNHGVISYFDDVAQRHREEIDPTQRLRLHLWDALVPVDEYLQDADPRHQASYRAVRVEIEAGFAGLLSRLDSDTAAQDSVERARQEWTTADRQATALLALSPDRSQSEALKAEALFHAEMASASDRLEAVYEQLIDKIQSDHDAALRYYERSIWLSGIAGVLSLAAIALGVTMIGRVMKGSVDRLVDGAIRFAEGDRAHRIEVQVPPELHRVAEEFNHMIGRIHESEAALSELVHRDALTGLLNRRAFENAIDQQWAAAARDGTEFAMLALDIDHFKRTNDSLGHAAGDEVLRRVAKLMLGNVRPLDQVFRTGGEEFVVLLPETGRDAACEAAERLRRIVMRTSVMFETRQIAVTVSIGIATSLDAADVEDLEKKADRALYGAKTAGRNQVATTWDHTRKLTA